MLITDDIEMSGRGTREMLMDMNTMASTVVSSVMSNRTGVVFTEHFIRW